MEKKFTLPMKIFSLLILILLSSCYTDKKATKQVVKAHAFKPEITANLCNSFYPVKDSIIRETNFIQGKTDTVTFLSVDTIHDTTNGVVYLDRINYKTIRKTDTVIKTHIQYRESTSKVKDLSYKNNELSNDLTKCESVCKSLKSNRNGWRYAFLIFVVLYLLKVTITKKF